MKFRGAILSIVLELAFVAGCGAGTEDAPSTAHTDEGGAGGGAGSERPAAGSGGEAGGPVAGNGGQATAPPVVDAGAVGGQGGQSVRDAGRGDRSLLGSPPADGGLPCRGDEVVCDDFETQTGSTPGGKWKANGGGSRLDGTHVWSGKQAVKFFGPVGPGSARISPVAMKPWSADEFFGRMMLYFEAIPAGMAPAHFALVRAENASGGAPWLRYGGSNSETGDAHWDATYYGGSCDQGRSLFLTIPKNQWLCYEWSWNRATKAWSLWVNGLSLMRFSGSGSADTCWSVPTIANLSLGWMQDHPTTTPLAMWMDDVAIADHRIGCPAPGGK